MKNYLTRIILIVAFILFAGYLLWPTYMDSVHEANLTEMSDADSTAYFDDNEDGIRSARENRLKLGLDLQGGMYVTLEVDIAELLTKLAKNEDENLRGILESVKTEALTSDEPVLDIFRTQFEEKGMRLSRYYGDIRSSNSEVMDYLSDETEKAVERALEIIRNRIDQYGVSEVAITRSGSRRIILELPGVSDEREVRRLIQETAQLEFKLLAEPNQWVQANQSVDKTLLGKSLDEADETEAADDSTLADNVGDEASDAIADAGDTAETADSTADAAAQLDSISKAAEQQGDLTEEEQAAELEKFKEENPFTSLFIWTQDGSFFAPPEQRERINNILSRDDVRRAIPEDMVYGWSAKARVFGDGSELYEFYWLKSKAELTGEVITNAQAQIDQGGLGGAVVTMQMDAEGSREWARVTGANVNKRIAIVLDNAVFSAPNVRQKIIGGNSQIEGMENMEEARLLEIVLKAGALPAPVEIIEERTVGPSLGEDSINKGASSFIIGLVFVIIFMVLYYQYGGVPADIAVIFNVLFILAILAGFHGTLTLPGIAGILLTVGMAVDANVLINERIREEFAAGKTLRAAIDAGYSRAFPAIIDSNLTTLLTSIILYQFGSGPVQGFALTLMIGIICSLFTAIILTRVVFEITVDKAPNIVKFG
ncbi:MAG: protein translocase subunit SecD [Ignavibacteria bacterium]|nr:MAG: protein translocase subunit SecD [Ignavibacteria bacterium]